MTSDVDNLVRGELSEVREGVRILQVRMTSLEENTAASELNAAQRFPSPSRHAGCWRALAFP